MGHMVCSFIHQPERKPLPPNRRTALFAFINTSTSSLPPPHNSEKHPCLIHSCLGQAREGEDGSRQVQQAVHARDEAVEPGMRAGVNWGGGDET